MNVANVLAALVFLTCVPQTDAVDLGTSSNSSLSTFSCLISEKAATSQSASCPSLPPPSLSPSQALPAPRGIVIILVALSAVSRRAGWKFGLCFRSAEFGEWVGMALVGVGGGEGSEPSPERLVHHHRLLHTTPLTSPSSKSPAEHTDTRKQTRSN